MLTYYGMNDIKKDYISTTEAAKILGVSRIAVHKKIRSGEIAAQKIGRNYIIERQQLHRGVSAPLRETDKRQIERAVRRTVSEYGETLRLLGKE